MDTVSYTHLDVYKRQAQYLMDEHTSLTCFWGSMMNVPDEQRKVIDELDIRFKTISDWIYFVSYKTVSYTHLDY